MASDSTMASDSFFGDKIDRITEEVRSVSLAHRALRFAVGERGEHAHPDREEDDFREVFGIPFRDGWVVDLQEASGALRPSPAPMNSAGQELVDPILVSLRPDSENNSLAQQYPRWGWERCNVRVYVGENGMADAETHVPLTLEEMYGLRVDLIGTIIPNVVLHAD